MDTLEAVKEPRGNKQGANGAWALHTDRLEARVSATPLSLPSMLSDVLSDLHLSYLIVSPRLVDLHSIIGAIANCASVAV